MASANSNELSNLDLFNLGINVEQYRKSLMVNTIEELKQNPPMIVMGEAQIDVKFRQNNFEREQCFSKKNSYVMALGVYQQLQCDPITRIRILKPSKIKFKNIYHPYHGQDLSGKTLLVWRQGGIGDLLFISASLRYIKKLYPTSKIIFGCGAQYQSMVKEWGCVDEIIDLPFSQQYMFKSNYHALFEGVIERTKEAEKENAYILFSKWLGIDIPINELYPEQTPNQTAVCNARAKIKSWGLQENKFILVQMRASSPIRTPRPSIWIDIIDRLTDSGHKIIITDLPHKSKDIDMLLHKVKNKDSVYNFSLYSKELSDTIALASLSEMVLGVDSSIIHIAESLGRKSFSLFGSFPGEIRLSTYRYADWVNAQCHCSPCFTHGQVLCRNNADGYVTCFDSLDIAEIVTRIENSLAK